MKGELSVFCFQAILILSAAQAANPLGDSFDATTEIVGRSTNGMETPVNQLVTPAGIQIPLPGMRPNALALSPLGNLLVTSGLQNELLVVDPATGKILQQVPFPEKNGNDPPEAVSPLIIGGNVNSKLSFTGLVFSPDGKRIYLSSINGDLKVFSVRSDKCVSALFSIPLPEANIAERKFDIPTGIAVSPDNMRVYVALDVGNKIEELDASTGKSLRTWDTGNAPYDVVLCKNKLYVSNWGGAPS